MLFLVAEELLVNERLYLQVVFDGESLSLFIQDRQEVEAEAPRSARRGKRMKIAQSA